MQTAFDLLFGSQKLPQMIAHLRQKNDIKCQGEKAKLTFSPKTNLLFV
jgi:hypothetical protein